jgi:ssDNA thymidine ADP-ribosyltransferase, DarT
MLLKITNPFGKLNRVKEEYPYAYYFYHFTDIANIPSILGHSHLFSRTKCRELGIPVSDSASRQIIDETKDYKKNFVRLYFRPLTPMQYRIEGFVPVGSRYQDAHCPIPVFLLFDSMSLLIRDDFRFSKGNFAAADSVLLEKWQFERLPFNEIYSTGPFDRTNPSERFHRQAEVLFRESLPLTSLKYIVCRSRAEHGMLQYLLHQNGLDAWSSKVVLLPTMKLFYSQRLYVKEVFLGEKYGIFSFNTVWVNHKVTIKVTNKRTAGFWMGSYDYSRESVIEIEDDFFTIGEYYIEIQIDGIQAHESFFTIF